MSRQSYSAQAAAAADLDHLDHQNPFAIHSNLAGLSSGPKLRATQMLSGTKLVNMGDSQEKGPTSLFIFQENNFIRLKTRAIIENSVFEWTVLATIIANCVALAMEAHLPNNDKTELAIQIVSIVLA